MNDVKAALGIPAARRRLNTIAAALGAVAIGFAAIPASAARYYVSPDGAAALSTSAKSPGSLAFALDGTGGGVGAARSGDTVLLEPGTYDGAPDGYTVYNPGVTFRSLDWHSAIVTNSSGSNLWGPSNSSTVTGDECQGIVFGPSTGLGWSGGGGNDWEFLDCEFVSNGGVGAGNDSLFQRDVFSDAYDNAFDFGGVGTKIEDCIARRGNRASADDDAVGNKEDYSTDFTVDDLIAYDNNGAAMWFDTDNDGWLVENSTFFGNHGGNNWYYCGVGAGISSTQFTGYGQDGQGISVGQPILCLSGTQANIGHTSVVTAVSGSNPQTLTISPALPATPASNDQFAVQQDSASAGDGFISEANDDGVFTGNTLYSNTDNGFFDHSSGGTTYGGTGGLVITDNLFAYDGEGFFVWSDQRDQGPALVEHNGFKFLPGTTSAFDSWGSTPGAYPGKGQITFDYNDYNPDNANGDWAVWYTTTPPPTAGGLTAGSQPSGQDYLQNPATWDQDLHSNTDPIAFRGDPPAVSVWPAATDTNWSDVYFPNNSFGLTGSIHQIDDTDGAVNNTIESAVAGKSVGEIVTIPVSAHTPIAFDSCKVYDLDGRWVPLTVDPADQATFLAEVPPYVTCGAANATQTFPIQVTLDNNSAYSIVATYNPNGGLPPAVPQGLSATAGPVSITLSWQPVVGAASYSIYRGIASGAETIAPIAVHVKTTSYTNTGLTAGKTYYYKVVSVNRYGNGPRSAQASATPAAASGGTLTGSVVAASSAIYDLTTLGTSDWAHWGDSDLNRKATGGSQISDVTAIGGGSYGTWTAATRNVAWTDGSPTASASDDQSYIWCNGTTGEGWTFTVPATTATRTLTILCGGPPNSDIALRAHLGDGSAPDYTSAETTTSSEYTYVYTLTYASATTTKMTITLTKNDDDSGVSVDLDSAWLSDGG